MARFLLSAAHKSSGKTLLATGICAAFRERGHRVCSFKKGPDYIDPLWLGRASGQGCFTLDFNTMSHEEIVSVYWQRALSNDIAIIEANKGLYDGVALDGSNSNAALATLLQTPVVLVIDCRGITRGIAPLLLGYQAFGPEVAFAGVILNRVGGARHASKLRAAVETYTDFPVLGVLQEDSALHIEERHLGLIPSNEHDEADARIATLADRIRGQVQLDALLELGQSSSAVTPLPVPATGQEPHRLRIAVARDAAFGFYYANDLEALERGGAELVFFDSLRDQRLPDADGLWIGGGFPEMQMAALEANRELRAQIRIAIESGLPAYAECGGLMYLARSLRWGSRAYEMVGILPGDVIMTDRPVGRGYVQLEETEQSPWPGSVLDSSRTEGPRCIAAHEFHYSHFESQDQTLRYAYRVLRGYGVDGHHDGIIYRNLLASYAHLQHSQQHPWTERFLQFIRNRKPRIASSQRAENTSTSDLLHRSPA